MPSIFESVVDVWLIWGLALVFILLGSRRVIKRCSTANLRRFLACEEGASYALPYVLTFPIFVLLMAVFVQASLILICKIGTVYSAYSAARVYIVWQSAAEDVSAGGQSVDFAKFKSARSASLAMVPFASSNPRHLNDMYPAFPLVLGSDGVSGNFVFSTFAMGLLINVDRPFYTQMYNRLLEEANKNDTGIVHKVIKNKKQGASDAYIENKFKFAVASTRVQCSAHDKLAKWNEDVTVTIRYRMPFQVPGTARILGGKSMKPWWFFGPTTYYRDIESNVTLPSEAAKTPNGKIGIPYQPSLVLEYLNQ
jgi:hypothetical protein